MADLFFSGVQFVIAVIAAAIVAYLSIWLFDKATHGIDEWNECAKATWQSAWCSAPSSSAQASCCDPP